MTLPYTWTSSSKTDKGNIRRYNEDALLDLPSKNFWVVADGMGGHQAGDVASRMIVDTLAMVNTQQSSLSLIVNEIDNLLRTVNNQLTELSKKSYGSLTIGSTVLCMVSFQNCIAYMWAGDSRLYRFRNNVLQKLTKDHSEVQRLIDEGLISDDLAETHPSANVITKAIGATSELIVEVGVDKVLPADIFLLCTDGLYRELSETEITRCLIENEFNSAALKLVDLVRSGTAADNLSVIVARAN